VAVAEHWMREVGETVVAHSSTEVAGVEHSPLAAAAQAEVVRLTSSVVVVPEEAHSTS